ncbi:saccharopine dehydrogenase NADP-binding domain-containing protein [Candidatus Daviesbacteria bacterium]|nr:saccharopine dehydrogenase NADP-binding domain-containing protein [Candidatus Daviesbacteria bacterium]
MKVFVVGAGAVASVLTKYLSKDRAIEEICCGSIDLEAAKEFIDHQKVHLVKLDAKNPQEIAQKAQGFDLIINASLPNFNEQVMEAALKVGANYQDLCSHLLDLKHAEQLKFHTKFQQAKLVGLINTGASPGITNLLAKDAAAKLDTVSDIKIRLVEEQKSSELIFAWSPIVTLDEITSPPLIYQNGQFQLTKPFADKEEYEFATPFDKQQTVSVYGDEISTLPLYIKVSNINYKSSGTDIDLAKALYRLGLFNKKPVSVDGEKVIPVDFFAKIAPPPPTPKEMVKLVEDGIVENATLVTVVDVGGSIGGKKIRIKNTVLFPDIKEVTHKFPGATYISYPAGIAAFAFSKIIAKITTPGVFPPEALSSDLRKEVLIELETQGIKIQEEFTKDS